MDHIWPGPASSVEDRLLRKFLSSSDRGSKLAVRQVFFKRKFISHQCLTSRLRKMLEISQPQKNLQIWKNCCRSPNLWAKGNVARKNCPMTFDRCRHILYYAMLQTNTATISSSAITLHLRRSNCNGWTWPRKTMMTLIG